MRCPRCETDLRPLSLPELGESQLHLCERCEGTWYPLGSLAALGQSDRQSVERTDLAVSLVGDKQVDLEKAVDCPGCGLPMNRFTFSLAPEVKLDECLEHGIWLDDGELGTILDSIADAHRDVAASEQNKEGEAPGQPFAFTLRVLDALLSKS